MTGTTLLDFATVGSFIIAVIGIVIKIYWVRKPKLVVDVEKSSFVRREEGIVDYQINVHFSSLHGDSYIKEIMLISDEEIAYQKNVYDEFVSSKKRVDTYVKYVPDDLTTLPKDEFEEKVHHFFENDGGIELKNVIIGKDLAIFCTFIGRLAGRYYSDHSRFDIKPTGWKLRIESGNGVENVYLDEEFLREYIQNNT